MMLVPHGIQLKCLNMSGFKTPTWVFHFRSYVCS